MQQNTNNFLNILLNRIICLKDVHFNKNALKILKLISLDFFIKSPWEYIKNTNTMSLGGILFVNFLYFYDNSMKDLEKVI